MRFVASNDLINVFQAHAQNGLAFNRFLNSIVSSTINEYLSEIAFLSNVLIATDQKIGTQQMIYV